MATPKPGRISCFQPFLKTTGQTLYQWQSLHQMIFWQWKATIHKKKAATEQTSTSRTHWAKNKIFKSAQRDANTVPALAVVRFRHRPPTDTNQQVGAVWPNFYTIVLQTLCRTNLRKSHWGCLLLLFLYWYGILINCVAIYYVVYAWLCVMMNICICN